MEVLSEEDDSKSEEYLFGEESEAISKAARKRLRAGAAESFCWSRVFGCCGREIGCREGELGRDACALVLVLVLCFRHAGQGLMRDGQQIKMVIKVIQTGAS